MVKKGNTKGWHWEYWKACFESHLVEKDNTHLLRILALEIYGLVLFLFDIKIIDEGGALNIFAEVETPGILAILLCGSIHRKRGIKESDTGYESSLYAMLKKIDLRFDGTHHSRVPSE